MEGMLSDSRGKPVSCFLVSLHSLLSIYAVFYWICKFSFSLKKKNKILSRSSQCFQLYLNLVCICLLSWLMHLLKCWALYEGSHHWKFWPGGSTDLYKSSDLFFAGSKILFVRNYVFTVYTPLIFSVLAIVLGVPKFLLKVSHPTPGSLLLLNFEDPCPSAFFFLLLFAIKDPYLHCWGYQSQSIH